MRWSSGTSSDGFWSESSLMESFALILLGTNFYCQEGNGSRAFKRTGLISGLGWSAYLPTVEIMDPYLVTYFGIFVRPGVPKINEDIRRRVDAADKIIRFVEIEDVKSARAWLEALFVLQI
jgi:hypothetical protein